MKLLARIVVLGDDVVPWSVPHFGTGTSRAGKRFRFMTRNKKLDAWQAKVKEAAEKEIRAAKPYTGSCKLQIAFLRKTPAGKKDGDLWDAPVQWSDEAEKFVKKGHKGKVSPDLLNMFKSTEDALEEVVFANDVQTRWLEAVALYGPMPGIVAHVYTIDHNDAVGLYPPCT